MTDERAEHARLDALVRLRIEELREVFDRRERERRWDDHDLLQRVERRLAELVEEVAEP